MAQPSARELHTELGAALGRYSRAGAGWWELHMVWRPQIEIERNPDTQQLTIAVFGSSGGGLSSLLPAILLPTSSISAESEDHKMSQTDLQPAPLMSPSVPLLLRTILGMVLYIVVDVLHAVGFVAALFVDYGRTTPSSIWEYIHAYLNAGGGAALLLLPLVYLLLRRPESVDQFPAWRRTLISFWLGFVSYSVLLLPCVYLSRLISSHWLNITVFRLEMRMESLILLELMLIIAAGCVLMRQRWFAIGLLSAYGLIAAVSGNHLADARLIGVPHELTTSVVVGYLGPILLMGIVMCLRARPSHRILDAYSAPSLTPSTTPAKPLRGPYLAVPQKVNNLH